MRSTSMLRRRLLNRDARVAVVGQGYVGLSLACAAAEAGFEVTGIDVDADRVDALAAGRLVVPGVDDAAFRRGVATGRLRFTADPAGLAAGDVICICVPTPVRDHTPD
ncbi:MAG: 3-hydroxyacyl-CoA dehydrogenase NAD-binding domain-containing protein, partial [Actinomycetes bacterium]